MLQPAWGAGGWVEGRAFALVEEEEGVKSRGAEAHGVPEAMKDQEGADACLASGIAGPYGQRTPSFRKHRFL